MSGITSARIAASWPALPASTVGLRRDGDKIIMQPCPVHTPRDPEPLSRQLVASFVLQQPAAVQFHAVVPPNPPPPPPQPSNAEPHPPAGLAGPAAGEPEPQEWSSSSLVVSLLAGKGPRSVRCQAAIHDVWTQSSAELALRGAGDHPQLAPVRGAASACGKSHIRIGADLILLTR